MASPPRRWFKLIGWRNISNKSFMMSLLCYNAVNKRLFTLGACRSTQNKQQQKHTCVHTDRERRVWEVGHLTHLTFHPTHIRHHHLVSSFFLFSLCFFLFLFLFSFITFLPIRCAFPSARCATCAGVWHIRVRRFAWRSRLISIPIRERNYRLDRDHLDCEFADNRKAEMLKMTDSAPGFICYFIFVRSCSFLCFSYVCRCVFPHLWEWVALFLLLEWIKDVGFGVAHLLRIGTHSVRSVSSCLASFHCNCKCFYFAPLLSRTNTHTHTQLVFIIQHQKLVLLFVFSIFFPWLICIGYTSQAWLIWFVCRKKRLCWSKKRSRKTPQTRTSWFVGIKSNNCWQRTLSAQALFLQRGRE